MLDLRDVNEITPGEKPLLEQMGDYIEEKNLNFIVAAGALMNKRFNELGREKVTAYLKDYAGCDFSRITVFNKKPSTPFVATERDAYDNTIARVRYLIDFNEEAREGKAGLFYSKMLGAFGTNFFAVQTGVDRLWFPFVVQPLAGGKVKVQDEGSGTFILK